MLFSLLNACSGPVVPCQIILVNSSVLNGNAAARLDHSGNPAMNLRDCTAPVDQKL